MAGRALQSILLLSNLDNEVAGRASAPFFAVDPKISCHYQVRRLELRPRLLAKPATVSNSWRSGLTRIFHRFGANGLR